MSVLRRWLKEARMTANIYLSSLTHTGGSGYPVSFITVLPTFINEDILKLDVKQIVRERNQGRSIKVVANLPYYITTPIIMGLFESHVPIESITIMVQKEVADRMQTGPGSKDYGALSLAVQYYAKPEVMIQVPPT